jgi:simple sugar transport system substrate-binding protein
MTGRLDRSRLLQLAGAAAAAAALPDAVGAASARFPHAHPRWRFVFVNHAITNPFFVPTRAGIADACSLFGVQSAWTGSRRSDVGEMVRAMRRAIDERADGIAVSLIDPTAFNHLTARALARNIPVVAYNADGGQGNRRLAYVGQDLYESGLKFGARVVGLVGSGDVFFFIATPGQANIQPRVDGALDAIRDSGRPIRPQVVATGAEVGAEREKIEATYAANTGLRGLFAVDGGSTQGVAEVMREHGLHRRGVRAGGYDLLAETLRAIRDGHMDFTIDQQPYLQGFVPIQQLFFARYSGGLVAPADTNTGLLFVTRDTVDRYLTTKTRFEGAP